VAVVLLPVLPAMWLGWIQARSLGRADEFQRVAQLEALAVGFGVAMFLSLVGGLLVGAGAGTGAQFLQITFIGGIVAWAAALFRAR